MMFIASLVMEPRERVAVLFALLFVGTAVSLIVLDSRQKLGGAVFGEVVKKPLETDARLKAMLDHQMPMLCNGA